MIIHNYLDTCYTVMQKLSSCETTPKIFFTLKFQKSTAMIHPYIFDVPLKLYFIFMLSSCCIRGYRYSEQGGLGGSGTCQVIEYLIDIVPRAMDELPIEQSRSQPVNPSHVTINGLAHYCTHNASVNNSI